MKKTTPKLHRIIVIHKRQVEMMNGKDRLSLVQS